MKCMCAHQVTFTGAPKTCKRWLRFYLGTQCIYNLWEHIELRWGTDLVHLGALLIPPPPSLLLI